MKKLLIGAVLAVIMSFAFATVASAQSTSAGDPYIAGQYVDSVANGSLPASYNLCDNQTVAQTYAGMPASQVGPPADQGNPTVVANVDPDGNGIACDAGSITGPLAPATAPATITEATTPTTTATPTSAPVITPAASTSTTAALPNTGGPILLLPAAALLIGSGLLAFGISRRR